MNSPVPSADAPPRAARIVIAEDEVLIRLMVADVLRREGFQVFEAASLDEAIGILESVADIDVVIADMHMRTARDGIALADYVRAHCPGVPLVLASGQIPSTLEGGTFDAFFPKPYRPEDIVAWIKRRLAGFGTRAP